MARHYSREADLKPKMIKVAKVFEDNENKRRLESCQTFLKSVKPCSLSKKYSMISTG